MARPGISDIHLQCHERTRYLGRLGYSLEQSKIAKAFDFIISRQLPDGTWPLDFSPSSPPFEVGKKGKPNKWITLDALKLIKLLY